MAINKNKVMDAARKARDKGQIDKAIKEYLKIVREEPNDVRVWLKIGDLYARKGAKPEATETYLKVARFYSEQGFYLKAVAVYKQILKLDPRLVEVNLKLAELYRQLGLMSDAIQHFEMVAAFFHREGKTREALATIRQLVDLDPDNVATRIKLAELYSKEGMVDAAVAEFGHAADYLRRNNRKDDFVKVAERLLWHKPDNMPLNRELACLYLERKDPRRALQKLQTCFKNDPRDIETLSLLAEAFEALEQKGKTVSVLKEMARILVDCGKRRDAEEVHRRILALAPSDPDSRAFLAEGAPRPETPMPVAVEDEVMEPARRSHAGINPTGSMPLVREEDIPEIEPDAISTADDRGPAYRLASEGETDLISELSLDEQSYESDSSIQGEAHSDEIVKILTETDVYVKYGLHQKALDHLDKVFELDQYNLEARERLKDIYFAQGRIGESLDELYRLAEQVAQTDAGRAEEYLREMVRISPDDTRAIQLARHFSLDLTGADDVQILGEEPAGSGLLRNQPDGSGARSMDNEFDFDDLDLDSSAPAPVPRAQSYSSEGFDFELDDDASSAGAAPPGGETMEVQLDQVEEAVSIADIDAEEIDFDAPPPGDPLDPHASEPMMLGADPGSSGDDLPFDPEDARAFDAERGLAPSSSSQVAGFAEQTAVPVYQDHAPPPGFETTPAPDFDDQATAPPDGYPPAGYPDVTPISEVPVAPASDNEFDNDTVLPPPEPLAEGTSLEDDLDEADFFVAQGLWDEAREILHNLLERHPHHPLVLAKLRDVDAMAAGGEPAAPVADDGTDIIDDVEALSPDDLDELDIEEIREPAPHAERGGTRPVVLLEKPIEDSDADTHYDLGLAYKEMGLYDEAIKAFDKVVGLPGREVQCHLMIGLCHKEQGNLSEAINQFKAGLYVETITQPEKFGLYYEIGNCYEDLDDPQEALYYYEMVVKKDPEYRDVANRVAGIRAGSGQNGTSSRSEKRQSTLDAETDAALDHLKR